MSNKYPKSFSQSFFKLLGFDTKKNIGYKVKKVEYLLTKLVDWLKLEKIIGQMG